MMITVKKLNKMSSRVDVIFNDNCVNNPDETNPDVILLRSFDMTDYPVGDKLKAVCRLGAGVNNIPHKEYAKRGIVVFNTPGANAHAVAELTIAGMFLAARHVKDALFWMQSLPADDNLKTTVEKGKSAFSGFEISGKTLGLIGFGQIAKQTAKMALALGMKVASANRTFYTAEMLEREGLSGVEFKRDFDEVFASSDFVSLHVPFAAELKGLVNDEKFAIMKNGAVLINNARGELVDSESVKKALESGKLSAYVTDFCPKELLNVKNVIALPHLGASTAEAEDNCADMIAAQLTDFLKNGNVKNSVNFPDVFAPLKKTHRLLILGNESAVPEIKAIAESINADVVSAVHKSGTSAALADSDEELDKSLFEKTSGVYRVLKIK